MYKYKINGYLIVPIILATMLFQNKYTSDVRCEDEINNELYNSNTSLELYDDSFNPDEEKIRSICELSTQEYYYHNVAKYYQEDCKKFLFWKKDKHFWIEYEGVATVGIDASEIKLKIEENTLNIYVPTAKVINTELILDDTEKIYVDNKSVKVYSEDVTNLYNTAEKDIYDKISKDQEILLDSQTRAKELISDYISNIEKLNGNKYYINWVSADYFSQQKPKKEYKKVISSKEVKLTNDLIVNNVEYEWTSEPLKRENTDLIVLHHSATDKCSVEKIHQWHQEREWFGIGYHYVVLKDGTIYTGRPEWSIGTHARSANKTSIGICFEGNYDITDEMPYEQKVSGNKLINYLKDKYKITDVKRHSEICATACPGCNFPFDDINKRGE